MISNFEMRGTRTREDWKPSEALRFEWDGLLSQYNYEGLREFLLRDIGGMVAEIAQKFPDTYTATRLSLTFGGLVARLYDPWSIENEVHQLYLLTSRIEFCLDGPPVLATTSLSCLQQEWTEAEMDLLVWKDRQFYRVVEIFSDFHSPYGGLLTEHPVEEAICWWESTDWSSSASKETVNARIQELEAEAEKCRKEAESRGVGISPVEYYLSQPGSEERVTESH